MMTTHRSFRLTAAGYQRLRKYRDRYALVVISVMFALLGGAIMPCAAKPAQDAKAGVGASRQARQEWRRTVAYGRTLVKSCEAGEMVSAAFDDLPKRLMAHVGSLIGQPLRDESEPFVSWPPFQFKDGFDVTVRVFAARDASEDDLVEIRWLYLDRPISILLSNNARRISFDLQEIPECRRSRGRACVAKARDWVEQVVRLRGMDRFDNAYDVKLPWPSELVDGESFSSNPGKDIAGAIRWHWRIDASVDSDVLNIFIYKRIAQLMTWQEGSKWFPDEFRARVHEAQRVNGRVEPRDAGDSP